MDDNFDFFRNDKTNNQISLELAEVITADLINQVKRENEISQEQMDRMWLATNDFFVEDTVYVDNVPIIPHEPLMVLARAEHVFFKDAEVSEIEIPSFGAEALTQRDFDRSLIAVSESQAESFSQVSHIYAVIGDLTYVDGVVFRVVYTSKPESYVFYRTDTHTFEPVQASGLSWLRLAADMKTWVLIAGDRPGFSYQDANWTSYTPRPGIFIVDGLPFFVSSQQIVSVRISNGVVYDRDNNAIAELNEPNGYYRYDLVTNTVIERRKDLYATPASQITAVRKNIVSSELPKWEGKPTIAPVAINGGVRSCFIPGHYSATMIKYSKVKLTSKDLLFPTLRSYFSYYLTKVSDYSFVNFYMYLFSDGVKHRFFFRSYRRVDVKKKIKLEFNLLNLVFYHGVQECTLSMMVPRCLYAAVKAKYQYHCRVKFWCPICFRHLEEPMFVVESTFEDINEKTNYLDWCSRNG